MAEDDDWLSTTHAAEGMGLIPRTVYGFINAGDLPAYRIGRVIRIKRADLEDFIERHRVHPGELEHLVNPGQGDEE